MGLIHSASMPTQKDDILVNCSLLLCSWSEIWLQSLIAVPLTTVEETIMLKTVDLIA